jgi:hypothetical protein
MKYHLNFYVQMLLIAFRVHLMFCRTEHFTLALITFLSGNLVFEMCSLVDKFSISLESIQPETDLKFCLVSLCNFPCNCFPTTRRPLWSTALCIQNNYNSLSLCTLTLHITPCKHMRGDRSVSRQSHTAGTLAVSSSSTVKWTVCSSCCYIRGRSVEL